MVAKDLPATKPVPEKTEEKKEKDENVPEETPVGMLLLIPLI